MRSYALLERVEDELVDVWETSKEPLKLSEDDGYEVFVGYSDLEWPFDVRDFKNWKYWEGTDRIYGWYNPTTGDFKSEVEWLDWIDELNGDIPEGYDDYYKCQDYKNGEPVGEIYYE